MAQIPVGAGRRVNPGGYNPTSASPLSYGSQVGQAVEQLGATASGIGINQLQDQAQQRALADQQRQHEADAADKAAGIAALGNAKVQLREGVAGVAQRVLSGELDDINARSEWDGIRLRVLNEATRELPERVKAVVANDLNQRAAELSSVELGNASRTRLREVTRANLSTSLEGYERDAMEDRPKALALATTALQTLGPAAGMGPDDQVRALQGMRERTAFNAGDRLVLAAGRSIQALDQVQTRLNGEDFADLTPERRQTLEVKISNRRQSILHEQEVLRNRAEAAQARRLRDAEHAYKAAQGVLDGGAMLDDDSAASTAAAVAGTPYEAAFKTLVDSGAQRANFGSMTPQMQREMLIRMRAHLSLNGASPERMERYNRYEVIAEKTQKQVNEDALAWGVKTGLLREHVPINLNSFEGAAGSLVARIDQARVVSAQLKQPVSPLFAHEAPQLAAILGQQAPAQRARSIQTLAAMMPEGQGQALARQMAEKDLATALAFGLSTARTTENRPSGEILLKGDEAIKNKTVKVDDEPVTGWTARVRERVDKIRLPPEQAELTVQAAKRIMAGFVVEGSNPTDDVLRRSVDLALNGRTAERNGSTVVLPPGMSEAAFSVRLRNYPESDVASQLPDGKVYVRGQPMELKQFLSELPAAALSQAGKWRYAVQAGGTFVTNVNRQPVTITAERAADLPKGPNHAR